MDQEILKTNLLSIAVAGFLVMLTGALLYLFRNQVSGNIRFFLPIPPLAVASYIFVFNMYGHYGGSLPERTRDIVKELAVSTAITTGAFAVFTLLLIITIHYFKRQ